MENNYKIYGYDIKELIAVAEMIKNCNIHPDQLTVKVEMFKLGYQLGEKNTINRVKMVYEDIMNRIGDDNKELENELHKKDKRIKR